MITRLAAVAALLATGGCALAEDQGEDKVENLLITVTTTDVEDRASNDGCSPSIREIAEGFGTLFYEQGRVREAYETYVAEDYKQHNPGALDGRDAAIAFLEPIYEANPQHQMTVHKMIVEDPYIVVHLHGQSSPDDLGAAAVDILRVENCMIVEHWDVTQAVPETSVNGNGMF